jgi:hypothetical protein
VAERSKIEQVKSGFRIASWIIGSIAILFLLINAEIWLRATEQTWERALGIALITVISIVLYKTAQIWGKWFIGYCIYRVFWAPFYILKEKSINWFQVAEFAAVWAVVIALGYRFVSHKPGKLESLGLTILIVSLAWAAGSTTVLPALLGVLLLAISRFLSKLERRGHKRKREAISQPE